MSMRVRKLGEKSMLGLTINLKDLFGFAEHQQNATYSLGYKIKLNKKQ